MPLRHFDPVVRFCGNFYGQIDNGRPNPAAIAPGALVGLLEALETEVTELCCHPGYTDGLKDWYREERVQEVRTLCDQRVRATIERLGIRLISFRELAAQRGSVERAQHQPVRSYPVIAVIVLTHNRAHLLRRCVEDVLLPDVT